MAIFVSFLFKILLWTISNVSKVKRMIYIYMYVSHFKLNEEATLKGKMGLLCQLAKL